MFQQTFGTPKGHRKSKVRSLLLTVFWVREATCGADEDCAAYSRLWTIRSPSTSSTATFGYHPFDRPP
eukprot:158028-Rhodomonas_salina.1